MTGEEIVKELRNRPRGLLPEERAVISGMSLERCQQVGLLDTDAREEVALNARGDTLGTCDYDTLQAIYHNLACCPPVLNLSIPAMFFVPFVDDVLREDAPIRAAVTGKYLEQLIGRLRKAEWHVFVKRHKDRMEVFTEREASARVLQVLGNSLDFDEFSSILWKFPVGVVGSHLPHIPLEFWRDQDVPWIEEVFSSALLQGVTLSNEAKAFFLATVSREVRCRVLGKIGVGRDGGGDPKNRVS